MYFVYLITTVVVFLHTLSYLSGRTPLFRRTILDIPLILFLLSQIISTFFSVDRHTSIFGYYSRLNGGLLSLVSYLLLYWILAVHITDNLKDQIVTTSLLSGLFVASYGITQSFGVDRHIWVQDVQNRVFSTLGQPNWLAAYLVILLPLALSRLLESKNKSLVIGYWLLVINFYLCLLLTKSKSGLIATIISLGLYFLLHLFKNKSKNFKLLIISYSFLILLSLTVPNPIKDTLIPSRSEVQNPPTNVLITPSEDIRKIVWTGAIDLWRQFPFFGTGPETFAYTYYWTRPAAHNLTSEWDFLYNKAHNEYLNYLATTGIFGETTYLLLIISISYLLFIHNSSFLISFLSILITNAAGFSVVTTSLYFFLLPALAIPPLLPHSSRSKNLIFKSLLVPVFLFLLLKNLFFYLADITYAQSLSLDTRQQYAKAYEHINLALSFRPAEPTYLSHQASLAAKLALVTRQQNYTTTSLSALQQLVDLSPFNLNFWKERAQTFYYLSSLDSKYFLDAINALTTASKLAPTDAKTFYLLGQFYQMISENDQAIRYYQQAIQLKTNYDHAYFALGKIYFDQKDYSNAKTNFENVLKYAPANTDAPQYLEKITPTNR